MERFRFLRDDLNNWYLIPEDEAVWFINVKSGQEFTQDYCKYNMEEMYGKYKLRNSIESYSFMEPRWEEEE